MGQGSPFFQEEFPKLSAGDGKLEEKSKDKDQGTQDNQYGPGPSLRPQSKFFPFKDFNGEPVLSKAPMIQTLTRFFRNVSDVAKWREGGGHGASQPPPVEGGEATPYEGERSASPSGGSTPSNPGVPPLLARSGMGGGGVGGGGLLPTPPAGGGNGDAAPSGPPVPSRPGAPFPMNHPMNHPMQPPFRNMMPFPMGNRPPYPPFGYPGGPGMQGPRAQFQGGPYPPNPRYGLS